MPFAKIIILTSCLVFSSLPAFTQLFNTIRGEMPLQPAPDTSLILADPLPVLAKKDSAARKMEKRNIPSPGQQLFPSGAVLSLPLRELKLTSRFGYRKHPLEGNRKFHSGIDLAAQRDSVYSILPGLVQERGYDPRLGNFVRVRHGELTSVYGHLSQLLVQEADLVAGGQAIGITGATGRVTGEHLHFTLRIQNRCVDPVPYLLALCRAQLAQKGSPKKLILR
ncbi:M23 family metallopeptidase [Paraflavisolibacter sp. H34]|uniref:M23 family metallopeptidase n=1 Tax=Huijunlia imazamoxiresistens TaxID=3127457 RepID=UPI0039C9F9E4